MVSFDNGDRPIALTAWPDGVWRATWAPGPTPNAVVRLRLSAATPEIADPIQIALLGTVTEGDRTPVVPRGGVRNAASRKEGDETISPGEAIIISGRNLAEQRVAAAEGEAPTVLGGVRVRIGGALARLYSVEPDRIVGAAPRKLVLGDTVQMSVDRGGLYSVSLPLTVIAVRPGVYTTSNEGTGQGAVTGPSGRIADTASPVQAGDVVTVMATGLGAVQPEPETDGPLRDNVRRNVKAKVTARVGGLDAEVVSAMLDARLPGTYAVQVRIPAGVKAASAVPLIISADEQPANEVTIAVR